jgi:hypothetical protein
LRPQSRPQSLPQSAIASSGAIDRRSHEGMDCHGAARLAMTQWGAPLPWRHAPAMSSPPAMSSLPVLSSPPAMSSPPVLSSRGTKRSIGGGARHGLPRRCAPRNDAMGCATAMAPCRCLCHCPGYVTVPGHVIAPVLSSRGTKRSIGGGARRGLPRRCAPRNEAVGCAIATAPCTCLCQCLCHCPGHITAPGPVIA